MNLEELQENFISFEKESKIYDFKIRGCYVWDYLRFDFFLKVAENKGIFYNKKSESKNLRLIEKIIDLPVDFFELLRIIFALTKKPDTIIISSSRRRYDQSTGKWADIYTDYLYEDRDKNCITIEIRELGKHKKPTITKNLYYYDFINTLILGTKLFRPIIKFNEIEKQSIAYFKNLINSYFGIDIDFESYVINIIFKHIFGSKLYTRLFSIGRPGRIILICSYGKEEIINSCKKLKLRTIELQHGTISKYHMGYHYPDGIRKHYIPDEFWLFGEYWAKKAQFVNGIRIKPNYGYPYLELESKKYNILSENKIDQILIISQWTIGPKLSKFVLECLPYLPSNIKLLYKLHPAEIKNWQNNYPWLKETNNRIKVLDSNDSTLYQLMAESRWQIGVYSTAIYEGIRFNCATILVNMPGIEYMEDLINDGIAYLIDKPSEIRRAIRYSKATKYSNFFAPLEIGNKSTTLQV